MGPARRSLAPPRTQGNLVCRHRIPLTTSFSVWSVSLRPNRVRAGRVASHTKAAGDRSAATSSRSARCLRAVRPAEDLASRTWA
jgi:hypothetical protein